MSGKYYMLVNPYIEGQTAKVFKADNSLKAAKMAYENFSEYFNNSVHNFKFTLLKLKSESVNTTKDKISRFNLEQYGGAESNNKKFNASNFSHFIVNEKINKNKSVNYEIKQYTGKTDNLQHLITNVQKIQHKFAKANNKANNKANHKANNKSQKLISTDSSSEQSGSGSGSGSGSSSSSSSSSRSDSSHSSSSQKGGNYDDEDQTSSSYQIGGTGVGAESDEDQTSSSYQIGGTGVRAESDEDQTSSSYQIGGANSDDEDNTSSSYQIGGKKSKSKYDDDDDDSPDYFVKNYYYDPISYWYYYPSVYSLDRLYLPTFISPLSFPYVLDFAPSISYNSSTVSTGNATVNFGL